MAWQSTLADSVNQGFNNLGEGLMWGGAAGNPIVMQGMMNGMLQRRAQEQDRRHVMAQFIFGAYQSGDLPWDQANMALNKLGFGDLPKLGDLTGANAQIYGNLDQMQRERMAAAGAGGGPGGLQPSTLQPGVPADNYQAAAPGTLVPPGMENDQAYRGYTKPDQTALVSEKPDGSGGTVKTYADGTSVRTDASGNKSATTNTVADITADMQPEERAQYNAGRQYLAKPPLTYQDVAKAVLAVPGMTRTRFNQFMKEQAPQIVKNDEEKRADVLKQMQATEELTRKRIDEPKTVKVIEGDPKDPYNKDKAEEVVYRYDPRHKRPGRRNPEDDDYVQLARGPVPKGQSITFEPFQKEAEIQSARRALDPEAMNAFRSAVKGVESLNHMEDLNNRGIYGGPTADFRTFLVNAFSPLATKEQLDKLAASKTYGTEQRNTVLNILSTKALGSGNGITENDRRYIDEMTARASYDVHARQEIINTLRHYLQYEVDYHIAVDRWLQDPAHKNSLIGFKEKGLPKFTEWTSQAGFKPYKGTESAVPGEPGQRQHNEEVKDYRGLLFENQ